MANTQTETKVIQVRFDNRKFEKNIQATIKSTEKLDKSLQFKGSKKGIEDLSKELEKLDTGKLDKDLEKTDKQLNNINITLGSLLKIKLLSKAIDVVTRSAVNMIKSMTGINNIVAGWDAYNESLTTTGGILNQVERDGYDLEDVADAMEKVRWYADETSYSFQTMTDGIRQFTIAGVDLEKATSAVQGVANLAGSAKVFDPFKVESAMNAVSKSMQTGYMDTLKWTTLTNTAGIVTKDFSEKLLKAAAAQGTLVESAAGQYKTKKGGKLVTTENIRDTLSQRWLTQGVLTEVLNEYNSATEVVKSFMVAVEDGNEESWKAVQEYLPKEMKQFTNLDDIISEVQNNQDKYDASIAAMTKNMNANNLTTRQAGELLHAIGVEFDEVSFKAFKSSQETTSFTQAVTYVGDAIKTSWSGVFQSMFGDVEKSTDLWSDVSDKFYGIFVAPFNALEKKFIEWGELSEGGSSDFRQSLLNIVDVLNKFTEAIKTSFLEVFGDDLVSVLQTGTLWLKDFTEGLKENEIITKAAAAIAKIIAAALKIILKALEAGFKIASALFKVVEPVLDIVVDVVSILADGLVKLINYLDEAGVFETIVGAVVKILTALGNTIKKISNAFKTNKGLQKFGIVVQKIFKNVLWLINKVIDGIVSVIEWFGNLFDVTEEGEEEVSAFATVVEWLKNLFEKIAAPFKKLIEYFKQLNGKVNLENIKTGLKEFGKSLKEGILSAFGNVKAWFEKTGIASWFAGLGEKLKPVGEFFKNLFHTIIDPLIDAAKTKDLKQVKAWILGLIGIIAAVSFLVIQLRMMYGATKVLSAVADMFWALESRFRASAIKAWGILIALIGATLLMAVYAFKKVIEIWKEEDWKTFVAAASTILVLLGVFFASIIIMFKVMDKNAKFGIRSSISLIAMAISLTLALRSIKNIAEVASQIEWKDLTKALSIFATVGAIFALIMFVGKFGKLSPLLISYAKIILSVWAFLKIFFWMLDKLTEYDSADIDKAITIMQKVFTFIIVMASLVKLGQLIKGAVHIVGKITGTGGSRGLLGDFSLMFIGMAVIIYALSKLIKVVSDVPLYKLEYVESTFINIFVMISKVALGAMLISKIPSKSVEQAAVKIGSIMAAIAISTFAIVMAIAIAAKLSPEAVQTGFGRIIAIYAVVAGFAVLLLAVDRFIGAKWGGTPSEISFSKDKGFKKSGFMKTNIGSLILAITISVLAIALMTQFVASIPGEVYLSGFKRIMTLFSILSATAILMLALSKLGNKAGGNKTIKPIGLMIVTILAIVALGWVLYELGTMSEAAIKQGGIVVGSIVATLMVCLFTFYFMSKAIQKNNVNIAPVMAMVIAVTLCISAIAAMMYIMGALLSPEQADQAAALFFIISLTLLGMILGFYAISNMMTKKKVDKNLANSIWMFVLSFAAAILLIATSMYIISKINESSFVRSAVMIGVISILLMGMIVLMGALCVLASKYKKEIQDGIITVLILEGLLAVLIILMGMAVAFTKNVTAGKVVAIEILLVFMTGMIVLMGVLCAVASQYKNKIKDGFVPMLMLEALAAIMIVLIGMMVLVTKKIDGKQLGAMISLMTIMVVLIGIIGALTVTAGSMDKEIKKGFVAMLLIEVLMAGVIGLIIFAIFASKQLGGEPARQIGIIAAMLGVMIGLIAIIGVLCGVAGLVFRFVITGIACFALLEILMAGIIGLVIFANYAINQLGADPIRQMGLIAAMLGIMIGIISIIGVLCGVAGLVFPFIMLGIACFALLEILIAGMIGLVIFANFASKDIEGAIKTFTVMRKVVGAAALVVMALSLLAPFMAVGMVVMAGLELLLAGLAGIALLAAEAADGFASAFEKIANSLTLTSEFIKGLKEVDEKDINKLKLIAEGLMALGAAELVSGLGGFGKAILNFFSGGDPLDKIITSISGITPEAATNFKTVVDSLTQISTAVNAINALNLSKYTESLSSVLNPQGIIINVDLINQIIGFLNGLANPLDILNSVANSDTISNLFNSIFSWLGHSPESYDLAMQYINALEELLGGDLNVELTVTPVWNFDEFNSGLAYMDKYVGMQDAYNEARKAQGDYNEYSKNKVSSNSIIDTIANRLGGESGSNVNITQNFSPEMLTSYRVITSTRNAIEWATQGVKNAIQNNKLKKTNMMK